MSSVYNLLIGVTWRKISFYWTWGIGSSGELFGGVLVLVDLTPWIFGTRCTMVVALAYEQYLVALVSVIPGHYE